MSKLIMILLKFMLELIVRKNVGFFPRMSKEFRIMASQGFSNPSHALLTREYVICIKFGQSRIINQMTSYWRLDFSSLYPNMKLIIMFSKSFFWVSVHIYTINFVFSVSIFLELKILLCDTYWDYLTSAFRFFEILTQQKRWWQRASQLFW